MYVCDAGSVPQELPTLELGRENKHHVYRVYMIDQAQNNCVWTTHQHQVTEVEMEHKNITAVIRVASKLRQTFAAVAG